MSVGSFYGRRGELDRLVKAIERGESTLLIGGRRAGKTRLLEQLNPKNRLPDLALPMALKRPVFFTDVGAWSLGEEADAMGALLCAIGARSPTPGSSMQFGKGGRGELLDALRERAPLCVVIDEADRILNAPWAGEFLAWMRWLDGTNGFGSEISIVMAGGPVLSGYRNPDDKGSPPLNLAERLYLRPLDAGAIQSFIEFVPMEHRPWVARKGGGHPWLIERLMRALSDEADREIAELQTLDHVHATFPVWEKQLGADGVRFLRELPEAGAPIGAFTGDGKWRHHHDAMIRARYSCLIGQTKDAGGLRYVRGPELFLDWLHTNPEPSAWDLAVSYASEDEELARNIKGELLGHKVFFAADEHAYLWGEDLDRLLPNLYGARSRFVVVLSTTSYVRKHWTLVEFQAARERDPKRILFVSLGGMPPDWPKGLVYYDGRPGQLIRLASEIRKVLSL